VLLYIMAYVIATGIFQWGPVRRGVERLK